MQATRLHVESCDKNILGVLFPKLSSAGLFGAKFIFSKVTYHRARKLCSCYSVLSALYRVEGNTAFHVAGKTQASPFALDKE